MELRCVAIEYHDFPTVEWTVYFKNTGSNDTPILENIQAFDAQLDPRRDWRIPAAPRRRLADGNDYRPMETALKPRDQTHRRGGKTETLLLT